MNDVKTKKNRTADGRFPKGVSGNPSGRPLGSRNRSTLLLKELLEDDGESIIRKTLELAKGGNIRAVKLVLDRVLPARKDRCINLELKPVKSAHDLPAAFDCILSAIAGGRITPADGQALSEILAQQAAVLETTLRERRIRESHGPNVNDAESNETPPENGRNSDEEGTPLGMIRLPSDPGACFSPVVYRRDNASRIQAKRRSDA